MTVAKLLKPEMELMAVIRVMKQRGYTEALRLFPDYTEFITKNKNADLNALPQAIPSI